MYSNSYISFVSQAGREGTGNDASIVTALRYLPGTKIILICSLINYLSSQLVINNGTLLLTFCLQLEFLSKHIDIQL